MKRLASALLFSVATAAHAQAFTNLDFEAAIVVPTVPVFGFLNWNLAAPGWNHSPGADTGIVYHGVAHVGITQWFLLVDGTTPGSSPLQGNYSMQFASGHASSSPAAPWVQAYLSQTGLIPAEARSLTFLASGPLEVTIGGVSAPTTSLGGSSFAVDVSAHAGSVVEMRFINPSLQLHDPVTFDGVAFSTTPVPEPATWLLFVLGAALVPTVRRAARARTH